MLTLKYIQENKNEVIDRLKTKRFDAQAIVDAIIDAYTALPDREGRQQRRRKTNQEWKKI